MYCSKCGTENLENAKFCKNCGKQLDDVQSDNQADGFGSRSTTQCKKCGKTIKSSAVFCPSCGDFKGHSAVDSPAQGFSSAKAYGFIVAGIFLIFILWEGLSGGLNGNIGEAAVGILIGSAIVGLRVFARR